MSLPDTSSLLVGLSNQEAKIRLTQNGPNEIQKENKHSLWWTMREIATEPMLALLLACAILYLFLGEQGEAMVMFAFVTFVIGITFIQRYKAEHALEALKKMASPTAVVIRDGKHQKIPAREIVVGDIIVIEEGDRVPADAFVVSSRDLSVNESILTGESIAVEKFSGTPDMVDTPKPGGVKNSYLFAQTLVVSGHAVGKVFATGKNSQVGSIGALLGNMTSKRTLLENEINSLVKKTAAFVLFLCITISFLVFITTSDIIQSLLTGLSLAMSLLPEELPVVLIIFFALGVLRLSRISVLTRRMPVIETLGSTTVLCVDKTGTLTQNNMQVISVTEKSGVSYPVTQDLDISTSDSVYSVISMAALASDPDAIDPIDRAINHLVQNNEIYQSQLHLLIYEGNIKVSHQFIRNRAYSTDTGTTLIALKGAPESICALCEMGKEETQVVLNTTQEYAKKGFRVLAVCSLRTEKKYNLITRASMHGFEYLGLLAFEDPLRNDSASAVLQCLDAGIRVVIITGDYPATAQYIAQKISIPNPDHIVLGDDLSRMSQFEIAQVVSSVNVFARIVPSQKLQLINALKENHEVVGMTGDGVNDAPALKSAHIGIAMGKHGTDVARESASLILLNDDFGSLVAAVKTGRIIYDNIKKAASYIIAIHVPIAGMATLPLLFGLPVTLLPIHIALLELVIDPACTVVFEGEKEEGDIMKRKPRPVRQPLFDIRNLMLRLMQGAVSLISVGSAYAYGVISGFPQTQIQGILLFSLISSNIALIASNLSWGNKNERFAFIHNSAFRILIGAMVLFGIILHVFPSVGELFKISVSGTMLFVISFCVAVATYIGSEIVEGFETTVESNSA